MATNLNLSTLSTADLVAVYNEITGESITRFASRAEGEAQVADWLDWVVESGPVLARIRSERRLSTGDWRAGGCEAVRRSLPGPGDEVTWGPVVDPRDPRWPEDQPTDSAEPERPAEFASVVVAASVALSRAVELVALARSEPENPEHWPRAQAAIHRAQWFLGQISPNTESED